VNPDLINAAKAGNLIPFIGAGFSQNLGLPSWGTVISLIAKKLGWSPEVMRIQGDFYQIAEYFHLERGGISELRSELDLLFHNTMIDITKSDIHSLLVDLDPPIIYTTNWDSWIEKAFEYKGKPCHSIRNLSDITAAKEHITQVVKFHGDFKGQDDDLVFTESSYFDRLNFESAIDIKFRSDILGKVVVFIGYSFRDINIRFLWHKMMKLLKDLAIKSLHEYPKSYIVLPTPNLLQERLFRHKYIEVINLSDPDPNTGLQNFLLELVNARRP